MKDDALYLGHIRDAIEKVDSYISGADYKVFASNNMMVDAVVRQLEIIGEATNNLSPSFCREHPEIPFRDIIDMRNVLIHDYAGVNPQIVWDTCQNDLPGLKKFIAQSPD
jgi:uncharacterized protein with HEPN domain